MRASGRGVSGSAFFTGGMNSAPPPMFIDDRCYRVGYNVLHRGGTVGTRPGFRTLFELPPGRLQGLTYFRPISGEGHLVFAVAGLIYYSRYPFDAYVQITGVQMYEHASRVWFSSAIRSAERNADGTVSAIEPKRVLLVQDGAYTRCGWWDGTTAGHLDPTVVTDGAGNVLTAGTPAGKAMAWSGDRLWVANGNKVFASDIADPFSFVENEYLAEGGFFLFDDDVTALVDVPSSLTPTLFVFTQTRTYLIKSGLRDRSAWKATDNFQAVVFPDIGCVSSRAAVTRNGLLWWMSLIGLTNFNSAQQAAVSSKLVPADVAMRVSKDYLDPNMSRTALGVHENFLLCSVPSGHKWNEHTWVFDQNVATEDGKTSAESWAGIWMGPRPVEWASGLFNDVPRVFCISKDADGGNTLFEAFDDSRKDDEDEISCEVETKVHLDYSEKATGLDRKKFIFGEVTLYDVLGDVDLSVWYAGTRGKFKKLGDWSLVATEGSAEAGVESDLYETYRGQQRLIRTPNASQAASVTCTSCGVESTRQDWIDVGFALKVRWTGRAALQAYRLFADPEQEQADGDASFTETGPRILSGADCT